MIPRKEHAEAAPGPLPIVDSMIPPVCSMDDLH